MEGVKKSLQVTIENPEFAKAFHYFLTIQIDGDGEKVSRQFLKYLENRGEQMYQQQSQIPYFLPILSTCQSHSTDLSRTPGFNSQHLW